ncbi:MAG TPA: hypothetical protein VF772_06960 [Terriglobales bacterium]
MPLTVLVDREAISHAGDVGLVVFEADIDVLESATRGLRRMEAVLDRVPEQQVSALLAKLQAPPLNEIADMPTLVQVVHGLESIVDGSHPSAA